MTREDLIEGILEVFDDTYGKALLQGPKKKRTAAELIRLARKLKASRRVPSSLFGPSSTKTPYRRAV